MMLMAPGAYVLFHIGRSLSIWCGNQSRCASNGMGKRCFTAASAEKLHSRGWDKLLLKYPRSPRGH